MAIIIRRDRRNPLQGDIIITRKANPDIWCRLRQRAKDLYGRAKVGLTPDDDVFMTAGHWIFYYFTNPQDAERVFWG